MKTNQKKPFNTFPHIFYVTNWKILWSVYVNIRIFIFRTFFTSVRWAPLQGQPSAAQTPPCGTTSLRFQPRVSPTSKTQSNTITSSTQTVFKIVKCYLLLYQHVDIEGVENSQTFHKCLIIQKLSNLNYREMLFLNKILAMNHNWFDSSIDFKNGIKRTQLSCIALIEKIEINEMQLNTKKTKSLHWFLFTLNDLKVSNGEKKIITVFVLKLNSCISNHF